MAEDIISKINNYLLESEEFANDFLPLKDTLNPIKNDFNNTLQELKNKAENSEDLADRVFYLNRYTDLVKKVESVFDTRSKRLQQTLSMLTKLSPALLGANTDNTENENIDDLENNNDNKPLTPEQANEILKILNK